MTDREDRDRAWVEKDGVRNESVILSCNELVPVTVQWSFRILQCQISRQCEMWMLVYEENLSLKVHQFLLLCNLETVDRDAYDFSASCQSFLPSRYAVTHFLFKFEACVLPSVFVVLRVG